MSQPATPATTAVTFVVRFWCEWSQGQPRWRGRVEHVESGRQRNFLDTDDLLRFWQGFGIDVALPLGQRQEPPTAGDPHLVESS